MKEYNKYIGEYKDGLMKLFVYEEDELIKLRWLYHDWILEPTEKPNVFNAITPIRSYFEFIEDEHGEVTGLYDAAYDKVLIRSFEDE